MSYIEPINQTKLYGLNKHINELILLEKNENLPNKILLSGQKGLGKSTLAYHFINYALSKEGEHKYNIENFEINHESSSFKTIQNKSNPNLLLIDILIEKKNIDINQIRELISNLNKSSFNKKPRFVLIDNIEFLNTNSINALLKILEEPSFNVYFILINNNKKILPTLISRCINFKISLSNQESLDISNRLLDNNLHQLINKDLLNYYSTPGNIYNLFKFAETNELDIFNTNLKDFLKIIIKKNFYKKESFFKYQIYEFLEFYLNRIAFGVNSKIQNECNYFLNKISNTKRFNLDEELLFIEFEEKILNG